VLYKGHRQWPIVTSTFVQNNIDLVQNGTLTYPINPPCALLFPNPVTRLTFRLRFSTLQSVFLAQRPHSRYRHSPYHLTIPLYPFIVSCDDGLDPSLRNRYSISGGEEAVTHQPKKHQKEGARSDRDRVDGDLVYYLFLLEAWGLIV